MAADRAARRLADAVVLASAALVLAAGTAAAPPLDTAACDWDREYRQAIVFLGESQSDWTVTQLPAGRGGQALMEQRRAEVDPDVECRDVSSVVKHEWVHLQQARLYGSHQAALDAYQDPSGDVLEFVADCTAWRLGATYTPYLTQGTWVCDEAWPRAEARRLIAETGER